MSPHPISPRSIDRRDDRASARVGETSTLSTLDARFELTRAVED